MILYVATTNAGKLRDFRAAAEIFGIAIEPLPGLKDVPAPEETADTFEGNARLKAEFYSQLAPGEMVIADDSGLEVDALHGAPGVRSARYAEDMQFAFAGNVDERNNACLLHALADAANRSARYRCVLALAQGGRVLQTASGSVEGSILREPRGNGGFGYDPLFLLRDHPFTMAEAPLDLRQQISHRGRALAGLLQTMGYGAIG
ncbi:MAG: RdgB/HAM1 family non-canonical purine NTP pyrophosphatase [Acidobacteria bacterium]|nr:RdgB/HAM1 family non-canonical purine NTP pyrophosphatase [Acidobacteriota bacterium]